MSLPEACESTEPTPSPSGLLENDAVFDPELSHPDCYEIVWFNSDVENPIKLNRLRQISDYIHFFNNVDNCRDYIEMIMTASDNNPIFLVTSGYLSEKLALSVCHFDRISSIHCLTKTSSEEEWMKNNPKVSLNTH